MRKLYKLTFLLLTIGYSVNAFSQDVNSGEIHLLAEIEAEEDIYDSEMAGDYLYAVDDGFSDGMLMIFDLSNPGTPEMINQIEFEGFETSEVLVDGDHLYIASDDGLKIFDIETNPASPVELVEHTSVINHEEDEEWEIQHYIVKQGDILFANAGLWSFMTIDMSDIYNPEFMDGFSFNWYSVDRFVITGENTGWMDDGNDLRRIDFSDPSNLNVALSDDEDNYIETDGELYDFVHHNDTLFTASWTSGSQYVAAYKLSERRLIDQIDIQDSLSMGFSSSVDFHPETRRLVVRGVTEFMEISVGTDGTLTPIKMHEGEGQLKFHGDLLVTEGGSGFEGFIYSVGSESDNSSVTAGFTASSTDIEEGDQVSFTDQSTGEPTSWSWTFEGGTPSTSTEQNPSVTYETAGSFNVTLIVGNENAADTLIRQKYITVETADDGGTGPSGIVWEQNYGGSDEDVLSKILVTSDNGYIIAGTSSSFDVDVSENHSGTDVTFDDYWVAKLDASGEIEWEQNYGGTSSDEAKDIIATNDGGYLIAGNSNSDDGDVSGNYGWRDIWLVKTDASGEIEWQRNYGGSGFDLVQSIQQTSDDGYIFAGYSESSDNDVSSHYGSPLRDDYWVVKLDADGNIEWENNYGGSEDDNAYKVFEVESGGYLVAGNTESDDNDVENKLGGSQESSDIWILKLNETGEIDWQKNFGAVDNVYEIRDMALTSDGGFIIAYFEILMDYWVAKFNSDGEEEWRESYGGIETDVTSAIIETEDEDFMIAGYSRSNEEGFDSDVSDNNGASDFWFIKVDKNGNLQWEQNYGGSESEVPSSIQQTADGNFIAGGWSESSDIDVSGNYGENDIWVVKFEAVESNSDDDDNGNDNGENTRTEILYEDFDGEEFLPEGWSNSSLNINYTWFKGVFAYDDFSSIDPDHHSSALVTTWEGEEKDEWMISPEFDLAGTEDPTVSFYIIYDSDSLQYSEMKLNISTDTDHENWTELWKTENDGIGFEWRRIEVDLSAYQEMNGLKLAWQYVGEGGDVSGNVMGIDSIFVSSAGQTSTSSENKRETPKDFVLHQNYPNPFNPSTVISYQVPVNSEVRLKVYDMLGREVTTLVNGRKASGSYMVEFDASRLSSGVYIYRLEAGGFVETRKMLLVK